MDLVFSSIADGLLKKMEFVKNWMGEEPWSWPWELGLNGYLLKLIPSRSESFL